MEGFFYAPRRRKTNLHKNARSGALVFQVFADYGNCRGRNIRNGNVNFYGAAQK